MLPSRSTFGQFPAGDFMFLTIKQLVFIIALCSTSFGQLWSGVLDPSRAIDWTHVGAAIPTTGSTLGWTQCGSTIPAYGGPAATINTAISNCGIHQYVLLGSGTFTLNTSIDFVSRNNVILKGSGAASTTILFTSAVTGSFCGRGDGVAICAVSVNHGDGTDNDFANLASWTSGYSPTTTSITINTFTKGGIGNMQVGSLVFLDQVDDSNVPASDVYVCQTINVCSFEGGSNNGRKQIPATQEEPQIVTSISGSGPWTIGISPGIRVPNIVSSRAPHIWYNTGLPIKNIGIENVTIDSRSMGAFSTVFFLDCYNCWVKGCQMVGPGTHSNGNYQVWAYQSKNVTVRDSYFFGSTGTSNNYAMSNWTAADNLYENNSTQHMTFNNMQEGCIGCVQGYNFAIDDFYTANRTASEWQQASSYHHGSGDMFVLWEGNEGIGLTGDAIHGTSNLMTAFRDYWNGRDPTGGSSGGKTNQTNAVLIYTYNRFWNIIGNVLGTSSYHTLYSPCVAAATNDNCTSNANLSIYAIGYSGNAAQHTSPINNDPLTGAGLMRWGNCDSVTGFGSCRFDGSEVPAGLS